jgi:predicted RND superfamily exporter protein
MLHPGKLLIFYPKTVLAVFVLITAAMAGLIIVRGISFNGSPETLARHDKTLELFKDARKTFGDDRVIIAALTTTDVFTDEFLARLSRISEKVAAINGVDETTSLVNLKAIRRQGNNIKIEPLVAPARPGLQEDRETDLRTLRQQVTRDPLYARQFISEDGRTAAINIFLKPMDEARSREVTEEVERAVKAEAEGDEVLLAGVPIIEARGIRSMIWDIAVCSPLAFLLCFIVFLAAFRSLWGALLPMLALMIGLVWSIGLMVLFERPITLATLPLPTVLMAIGSSYIFHVLNQYRLSMSGVEEGASKTDSLTAWLNGLRFISPAVLISATTTMAGFGALASSSIPTVRDMGLFEAAGVFVMLLLSLAFIPSALSLMRPGALGVARQKDYALWLNGWLRTLTALILFRRRTVLAFFLMVTAIVGAGVVWLRVNTDYLRIFPETSETVQSAEKLHERLAGAANIHVIVTGPPRAATDPEFLDSVAALEQFALAQPGVDTAISIADIVKRLNSALGPDGGEGEVIPRDRRIIEDMYRNFFGEDRSLTRLVSADLSRVAIVLRTNLYGSTELRGFTDRIESWSKANLPAGTQADPTGSVVLLNSASDAVAESQTSSLLIALALIFSMMALLFRSFMTALMALIPNLLPIASYFGFLGWTGITLDITTSLVASVVLGMAVDNAVHMIRRYRQSVAERGEPGDEGWAIWLTMLRTGKPMVLANVMLVAANLIFVVSSFVPVRRAGLMWALGLFACLIADLIFLPALMKSKYFARTALEPVRAGRYLSAEPHADMEKV